MNQDLLELWGKTLLEMARISRGPQAFFDLFQDGFARRERRPDSLYEQFVDVCKKTLGKEGIETFNALMKEFYDNAGVVPRTQYNELQERYVELKGKVQELEDKITKLKREFQGVRGTPSDLMEQWGEAVKTYTQINRQFFEEFSKFFKQ